MAHLQPLMQLRTDLMVQERLKALYQARQNYCNACQERQVFNKHTIERLKASEVVTKCAKIYVTLFSATDNETLKLFFSENK